SRGDYYDRRARAGGQPTGAPKLTAKEKQDLNASTLLSANLDSAINLLSKAKITTHPWKTWLEDAKSFASVFGNDFGDKEWESLNNIIAPLTAEKIHDLAGAALTELEKQMY